MLYSRYLDDGKLLSATENEDRQGRYNYTFRYDDMGNRILEEEVKPDGTRKVEKSYEYTVENRLKAVSDKNDLLAAMAYDGDGNRIFQLNYNLHTDDDWKGNSGNGNGNNKDNPGSGNSGNNSGNGTGSKTKAASEETAVEEMTETEPGFWENIVSFFTGDKEEKKETATSSDAFARKNDKPNGNNGNGNGNGNKPEKPAKPNKPNDNTSTGSQHFSFYARIEGMINAGILTYNVDFCGNVKEESITITDAEKMQEFIVNTGLSINNILTMFPSSYDKYL